ncbi:MAG: LacI family transcriptional regulator [Chlorobi bacterium]|nr:LacI family transcriptional regulator [Chlorobiota bacterium]
MDKRRITIKDIADSLDVTPSTVSRALADNPRISESTKKLIRDKAEELGYEPNLIASTLRKGKSDTIGMIVPGINRSFFSNVISSVEEILNPAGFNLVIIQTHEKTENERRAIRTLLRNRVGAIIMSLSVQTKEYGHLQEITSKGIPLVQFDRVCKEIEGTKIVNDNFQGAYLSVSHLIKSGYRKIVHFTGALNLNVYKERFEGYKTALKDAGLEFDESLVFEYSITRDTGRRNINKAVAELKADALFSSGDFSALGAVDTLKEMGVKIPDDFGVVGYANEQFTEIMHPSMTSVEQNPQEMGNRIAKTIIKILNGEQPDEQVIIPVRLLIRESSWINKTLITY